MPHWSKDPERRAQVAAKISARMAESHWSKDPAKKADVVARVGEHNRSPERREVMQTFWSDPERRAARVAKMRESPGWQRSTTGSRKGGKVLKDGRIAIYWRGRYRLRARVVMEKMLGRELKSSELVHHVNGDCTDDREENLMVVSRSEHGRIHGAMRRGEQPGH